MPTCLAHIGSDEAGGLAQQECQSAALAYAHVCSRMLTYARVCVAGVSVCSARSPQFQHTSAEMRKIGGADGAGRFNTGALQEVCRSAAGVRRVLQECCCVKPPCSEQGGLTQSAAGGRRVQQECCRRVQQECTQWPEPWPSSAQCPEREHA
jgi:hypothetical protein